MWFVPWGGASTTTRRLAPSPLLPTAMLLCAIAIGAAPAAASTITGASLAICEPGPCLQATGVETVELANVSNDDGTVSTREYGIERPQNLVGPAPAVLVFYGSGECGVSRSSRFSQLAAANRFVVVYMAVPCGRDNNWDKRNVDTPTTSTPDDEPYVNAVVDDITRCPGQCADPQRVYAGGMSSGGNMVADIMCDPQNSPLFRGYMIDSSSLQLFNGAPHCPSSNRSYFAMLALSNYGIDAPLYYDTDTYPHLDVPTFADWAARRLGCGGAPLLGALGSPFATTVTYTYAGPCEYASPGSPAVVSLGVGNGAHGWGCQDSDSHAPPFLCPTMPNPPGLNASGLPRTNGLFVEEQFWNFVAQGESSSESAPPPIDTVPPVETMPSPLNGSTVSGTVPIEVQATDDTGVTSVRLELDETDLGAASAAATAGTYSLAWNTATASDGSHILRAIATDAAGNIAIASALVTIDNNIRAGGPPAFTATGTTPPPLNTLGGGAPVESTPAWVALGDDYTAGTGAPPYLTGSDTRTGRCRRSASPYLSLAARRLGIVPSAVAVHACAGTSVAAFYKAGAQGGEPNQLAWIDPDTDVVSLTVGWNDTSMPASIARCGRAPSRCRAVWGRAFARVIAALGSSARNPRSLRHLFEAIASRAPLAIVLAPGYPRPFPARPPSSCRVDAGLRLTRAAMLWIDKEVARLDSTIQAAAQAAHVTYAQGSYGAFAGHELCTRHPYLNATFDPDRLGQQALATLLVHELAD